MHHANSRDEKEIFGRLLVKFGLEHQLVVLAEECCELAQCSTKLLRFKDYPNAVENLKNEMTDVLIILAQIAHAYELWPLIFERYEHQMKLIEDMLNEHKE